MFYKPSSLKASLINILYYTQYTILSNISRGTWDIVNI